MASLDDLTPEQRVRIEKFKCNHGFAWKAHLYSMWKDGTEILQPNGHLLRQIRIDRGHTSWLNDLPSGYEWADSENKKAKGRISQF